MAANAWKGRRQHESRVRSALRHLWRNDATVRQFYPVKSDWINPDRKGAS